MIKIEQTFLSNRKIQLLRIDSWIIPSVLYDFNKVTFLKQVMNMKKLFLLSSVDLFK